MNRQKKRSLTIFGMICVLFLLSNPVWAITLSFNPAASSGAVGEMLDVHVVISGLEETNVAGFDFTVDYDDTILDFDFYMLGSELGDTDLFEAEDWSMGYLGNGQVHLSELSWLWDLNSQPDSFTLAVISFITENMGMSDLSFSEVILSDEQGEIIYADTVTGSLNATPEPATMLLLAAGLIGVVGLGRKFRKS